MREIKYRAWDKKSKKMRAVNSIAFHNENQLFDFNPSHLPKVINLWGYDPIEQKSIIVKREPKQVVLMQYAELIDKNKKEIYQGDIYLAERSYMPSRGHKRKGYPDRIKVICVVEWSVYDAGWCAKEISPIKEHIEYDKNAPYHYYHTSLSGAFDGNADWIEVIGNIYENPELIIEKPADH